jgi:uncharacterized protein YbjT (DUF2867 family)
MSTFAVLGATGRMGGATARALLKRGHSVRALTRNPDSRVARSLSSSGAEVIPTDMGSVESLVGAFAGVEGVFNVQPAFDAKGRHRFEEELRQGTNVAKALQQARVDHVVYGSAGGGEPSGIAHFDVKLQIEAALRSSCPNVTVLRPAPFMELMTDPSFVPALSTWGAEPKVAGWDTPLPWVAVADIGEVAARALLRPGELGNRELVLAADIRSLREARRLFVSITGRAPRGVPIPVWLFRRMVGDELVQMWSFLRDLGEAKKLDTAVMRSIHPEALTLETWIRTHRAPMAGNP